MTKRFNSTVPVNAATGMTSPNSVSHVSLTVYGQLYSMKNSKIRHFKNPKAQRFERDFMLQVPPEYRNLRLGGPLRLICTVYYPSGRQDLDCALVADLLQKSGIIENDRLLIEQHLYRETDAQNPRCEITVEIL